MQSRIDEIRSLGAEVVAVSADNPEESREAIEAQGYDFPVLCDPNLELIGKLGLLHEDGLPDTDISRPAVFILDEQRDVTWRELTDNWRVRVRPETILAELR
ncbi:hypothetical protein ABI59_21690 [Acidobacteria bacterium Mor1]|nr:hypothetical protein ABI59_21690 [Acidobacteria bacterium Mor1]